MTYNLTAVSNTTGVLDFIQKVDKYLFCLPESCGQGGLLGVVLMLMLFSILIINSLSNGREFRSAMMMSSFICAVLGGLLFVQGIINPIAIYVSIIVWALSAAIGGRRF